MQPRDFDVILYGATGFTGRQTVQHFQRFAPAHIRWAISGRSRERLEALNAGVPILPCDSTDPAQALALVSRTRVLLSTAGPFALYSDALVAACVDARTHYVDITGEIAWARSLIDRFHLRAEADGTCIVPFCGFDSIPSDLGVSLLVNHLGPDIVEAKAYFKLGGGRPNGGTIASAHLTYSTDAHKLGRDLFLLSPGPLRPSRPINPLEYDPYRAAYDPDIMAWVAPFAMSVVDTRVVRRSLSLNGTDLAYQEYLLITGRFARLWATAITKATLLFFKSLRSPRLRDLVQRSMQPGGGPSEKAMDNGFFKCRVRGRTTDGRTAEVVLSGSGDPANRITVKCVCESALAIACEPDNLPRRGGVLTPSVALGEALVERLRAQGISISVTNQ